jgi:hypothetical protein
VLVPTTSAFIGYIYGSDCTTAIGKESQRFNGIFLFLIAFRKALIYHFPARLPLYVRPSISTVTEIRSALITPPFSELFGNILSCG